MSMGERRLNSNQHPSVRRHQHTHKHTNYKFGVWVLNYLGILAPQITDFEKHSKKKFSSVLKPGVARPVLVKREGLSECVLPR